MPVRTETDSGVRILTLDRPPVNAIGLELIEALRHAIAEVREDSTCDAMVLTGANGMFSAGIDVREFAEGPAAQRELFRAINRMIAELYACEKPAVAAIPGHALGGALVLALACDHRLVAHGDMKLGLTEAAAGVPFPEGPLAVVRAELSPETARRLTLTSMVVEPDWLTSRGVLDEIVERDEIRARALRKASEMAKQPAFSLVKVQLRAPVVAHLLEIVRLDAAASP